MTDERTERGIDARQHNVATGEREETGDASIEERIERVEAIAERLEAGEVDLAEAAELRDEAKRHLRALERDLDVGDGAVIEFEG